MAEDNDYVAAEIGRVYQQGDADSFALKIETRDGGAYTATRWLTINRDDLGRIWGVFATVGDGDATA